MATNCLRRWIRGTKPYRTKSVAHNVPLATELSSLASSLAGPLPNLSAVQVHPNSSSHQRDCVYEASGRSLRSSQAGVKYNHRAAEWQAARRSWRFPALSHLPQTLAELRHHPKFSEEQVRSRRVKDELRDNLIARLRSDETVFPGIVGFDDTVVPQVVNAILSRHNFILLGLRGQAKSRI